MENMNTRHLVVDALARAERFMAGFEGDELQEGIEDDLHIIRKAMEDITTPPQMPQESYPGQAVIDAARAYVLVTGHTHTTEDAGKAMLALTMAVHGWETWACDLKWFSNMMGG